jgi:predicted unusual protein kinase regulating ubiquinone biosynthesis (AarF/ABC1/UbiB family)
MGGNPLVADNIIVPRVFDDISTRYVLVTEWVDGRKISAFNKEDPADRERLEQIVAVLLNSYLVQLLETGFLHADPHAVSACVRGWTGGLGGLEGGMAMKGSI